MFLVVCECGGMCVSFDAGTHTRYFLLLWSSGHFNIEALNQLMTFSGSNFFTFNTSILLFC